MTRNRFNRLRLVVIGMLAVALVSLVPAGKAFAQRQGGGRGGPGGRMGMLNSPGLNQLMMLRNPSVQTELKLTDDQKSKTGALADKVQDEMQGTFAELGELDPEDREAKMQEVRKAAVARGKEVQGELATILQPEQTTRLRQIGLQMRGVSALADEDVATDLKLTDDQKKQIASIRADTETASRELLRQAREARGSEEQQALRAKGNELFKAQSDKSSAVLTAEQKAEFENLKGPKADIKLEGGPGRGRGPRGQGQ